MGKRITKPQFLLIAEQIQAVAAKSHITCYVDHSRQTIIIVGVREISAEVES